MMKSILLFLLINLLTPFYLTYAQDIIVKKNGEEVKGKVLLVGKKNIQYKNFEDPEFSNLTIDIEKVKKIRFEDGTEKIFNHYLRHYIGLSFGSSDAMGDFRSHDTQNPKSGYARTGPQFFAEGGLYLVKNFGLAMAGGYFGNPMDFDRFRDPYPHSNVIVTSDHNETNRYNSGYLMTGPLYSLKIGKLLAIDAKILTGLLSVRSPAYALEYEDNNNKRYTFSYGAGKGSTLGLLGGLAVRFHITRYLGIRLATEYVRATPKIKYSVTKMLPGNTPTAPVVTEEQNITYQKIQVMKTSIGLVFLINRK